MVRLFEMLYPDAPSSYLDSFARNIESGSQGDRNSQSGLQVDTKNFAADAVEECAVKGVELLLRRFPNMLEFENITVGDSFDFNSKFPFLLHRLHRINGEPVPLSVLEGKWLLVCCVSVPSLWFDSVVRAISLTSYEVYDNKHQFEVVISTQVPFEFRSDAYMERFCKAFHSSCLILEDDCKGYIARALRFTGASPAGLLVDPSNIVRYADLGFLLTFDIPTFLAPSTPQPPTALDEILGYNYKSAASKSELKLARINNTSEGPYVPLGQLSVGVVGLYLISSGSFLPMLLKIHKALKEANKDFQIVLVYSPSHCGANPSVIHDIICTTLLNSKMELSWLVAPFINSVSRRLFKFCNNKDEQVIIVSRGDNNYIRMDPHGGNIMELLGVAGFPFTVDHLVERALIKLRQVTLKSLLVDVDGNEELMGKTVLICLDWTPGSVTGILDSFYNDLMANHSRDLEVISLVDVPTDQKIPWRIYYVQYERFTLVLRQLFIKGCEFPTVVAFGSDGSICSLSAHLLLSSHGIQAFPFNGDLSQEVRQQLLGLLDVMW